MADLGLDTFDRTVQETNRYLKHIMNELGWEDRQVAYHALRSVLFTLRDRRPTDLAAHFGAQLPLLVRGIYYEGYVPSDQPQTFRTRDEWNERVQSHYQGGAKQINPEQATTAVFRTLNREMEQGILQKVFSTLPEDVRSLWPEMAEPVAHDE